MARGHLALVFLLGLAAVISRASSQEECEIPTWPFQPSQNVGANPFDQYRGKVLLVALVKAYCHYCLVQARNLETLKSLLHRHGFPDIEMILINGGDDISRQMIEHLTNATNLPVYQDTSNNTMFNEVFHGEKDDFVIYDRCGQRTMFIPHPYSYLGHSYTNVALVATHRGRHDCHCRLDYQRSGRRQGGRRQGRRRRPRRDVASQSPEREVQTEVTSSETQRGRSGWGGWFANLLGYSSSATSQSRSSTSTSSNNSETSVVSSRNSSSTRLRNGGLSGGQGGRGRHRHHGHRHHRGRHGRHGHHRHHGRHGHHRHHGQTGHNNDEGCSHAPRGRERFGNWFVGNGAAGRTGGALGRDRSRDRAAGGNL